MSILAVAALVLLVSILAQPAVSQTPDDKLIVPGQRIGKWTLQMSVDDLARMNGRPGARILRAAGNAVEADATRDYILLQWDTVYAVTVDENRVESLRLIVSLSRGADAYETVKGIGSQSTRTQVLQAYGNPTAETKPMAGTIRLIYDKIGVCFRFDPSGILESTDVFRPGTAKSIWKY